MACEHQLLDMTRGRPLGIITRFSLPLLLGNAFQQLYNVVDSVVVGNFVGTQALAAVGIGFPIIFLLSSLFVGIGLGGSVMIAQFIGAGNKDAVRRTVSTIYAIIMVCFIPLTLLGFFAAGPILQLIRVPADTYPQALIYLQVVFLGLVGALGYNMNAGILQGLGDSKTPLLFLAIACVINIALDLLFVLVFHWGVFGVALATIIAQICSWLAGIVYINKKFDYFKIRPLHIAAEAPLLKKVLRLGIPSGVQQCQLAVASLVLQTLINGFGTMFTAGFMAANKIDTFAFMPIQSFCLALTTFVGQNVGAGRLDRVKDGVRSTMLLCAGVSVAMALVVVPCSDFLMGLFDKTPLVVAAGRAYLWRIMPSFVLVAVMEPINSALRGAGTVITPMISSILALWVVRVPLAYLLAFYFGKDNLFWAFPLGWMLGIAISGTVYLRGRWRERITSLSGDSFS